MKRLFTVFTMAVMFLCLCVPAFAVNEIEKPIPGQIINITCDGTEDWQGDFYLSALSELRREGNDLCLLFPAARIRLTDFFTENRRREFHFTGGESIGATDFDEEGRFTGTLSEALSFSRSKNDMKEAAWTDPSIIKTLKAEIRSSGTTVTLGDEALWGAERALVTDYIAILSGGMSPDWSKTDFITLEFESLGGDKLSLKSALLLSRDGLSVESNYCECIWLLSANKIAATAEGKGTLTFSNALGDRLCRMNFECSREENGTLQPRCLCPDCGEEQHGELHFMSCGHFSCTAGDEDHGMPQCGIAGHCKSNSAEHHNCSNCRQPLCNGAEHGYGLCAHEHNWMTYARTPASASADGTISNRCSSCGAEYTQIIPRYGM